MANESATYKGVTYPNGKVPAKFLGELDGDNLALPGDPAVLREDAAASWNRARAEVKTKAGITLTVRGWNRSIADQERFFFQRYRKQAAGGTDVRWYRGARYVRFTGAPAAIPGTSNHGLGLAVDIVDFGAAGTSGNARRAAAISILKKHGWTDEEGRSIAEPWHLVYSPAKDTQKNTTPEDDMPLAPDERKWLDDLHRLLTRKEADGSQPPGDTVELQRRDLIISRRNEARLQELVASNRAQAAAIETLAKSAGVDPKDVLASVEKAVRNALPESITIPLES